MRAMLRGFLVLLLGYSLLLPGSAAWTHLGRYTWSCTVTLTDPPVAHCTFTPVEP
jgi:hypothetical protein